MLFYSPVTSPPLTVVGRAEQLQGMYTAAHSMMERYFFVELEKEVLADHARLEELLNRTFGERKFPVPLHNSTAAKQMRFVAMLSILGCSLAKHVFKPVYHLELNNELSEMLARLALDDPERERFVRSVLLAVMRDQQVQNGRVRAAAVVDSLMKYADMLLPAARRGAFKADLQGFCNQIVERWIEYQRFRERIKVILENQFEVESDSWQRIRLPGADSDAASPSSLRRQLNSTSINGASTNGSSVNGSVNGSAGDATVANGSRRRASTVFDLEELTIVWPGFTMVQENDGIEEFIIHGFGLAKEQVNSTGRRREDREKHRASGNPKKSFLSSGNGVPPEGG